jgi:hypothetical protein
VGCGRTVGGQHKCRREGGEGAAKNGAQEPTREQKDSKRAAKKQQAEGKKSTTRGQQEGFLRTEIEREGYGFFFFLTFILAML